MRHRVNDLRHVVVSEYKMAKRAGIPRTVASLVASSRQEGREILGGIASCVRARGNGSLLHKDMTIDELLPVGTKESSHDGVVARVDRRTIEPSGSWVFAVSTSVAARC